MSTAGAFTVLFRVSSREKDDGRLFVALELLPLWGEKKIKVTPTKQGLCTS